ncbi:nucleotidyltransferase family protein [Paenibacillus sp. BR2-3]
MQLLIAFLVTDSVQDLPASKPELFRQTNWDTFIKLVLHHRVYPNIYPKIKAITEQWVPAEVIRRFHSFYCENTFRMLQLSGEMEYIGKELADSNINVLFLKGPVIAKDLYGDISLRTSCDLDLLIPLDDLFKAEALLMGLGYVKDDYIHTVLNDWKWRHHHITFNHPQKGIKVELHWRLNPAPSKEPIFKELWSRRRESSLVSYPIYYLGKEDLFLFLISHGARHGWSRLRWLLDIERLLLQQPDVDRLTTMLHKYHLYYIGGQALVLASSLLEAPIERSALQPMVNDKKSQRLAQDALFYLERMVNLHSYPVPDEVAHYHKMHQFSLLTMHQKLWFILSFLYPYPEDAETLPLPKGLHFLYIPLRPFLWAWRKTKRLT